jgi:N-acetylneuraminate synthase
MTRTVIIAEAGVNHNGDINLAKRLIEVAAEAGADYVKFQTFKAENLVSKSATKADYQQKNTQNDGTQFDMLKKLELSYNDHYVLINHCNKHNIKFLSTAFDDESFDFLETLSLDYIKISSGDATNQPFLVKVAKYNKKVLLSTGMCTFDEVKEAVEVLLDNGLKKELITVLHCNTEYPTPLEDVNISAMCLLSRELNVKVGYSDHTLGVEIPIAAVALGATVIEKHFTLDKDMKGPDHLASLSPGELKEMTSAIRKIEVALGDGIKRPSQSEKKNIMVARKSIHVNREISAGCLLEKSDLVIKRPGNGIQPKYLTEIIGRRLKHNLSNDSIVKWEDLD